MVRAPVRTANQCDAKCGPNCDSWRSSKPHRRWVTRTRAAESIWLAYRQPAGLQSSAFVSLRALRDEQQRRSDQVTLAPRPAAHTTTRAWRRALDHDECQGLAKGPHTLTLHHAASNALTARSRTRQQSSPHRSDAILHSKIQPRTAGRDVELHVLRPPTGHARSRAAAESHRRWQPVAISPVPRAALSAAAARRSRCSSRVVSATLGVSIGLLLALT